LQIIYNPAFKKNFNYIWDYIACDSKESANKFRQQLQLKIESISYFPYKFRKSYHYDDENTRDYIFKGYTIPYFIDIEKNQIIILDIFKWVDK